MLYLVATPIGNLKDITFRAIEILKSCDYILCEDTRHTLVLLNHYSISKPLISFHKFTEAAKEKKILKDLKEEKTIALVSDAGTPGISDPGTRLVQACVENGIKVSAIPGPCAAIAALSCSGLPTDRFEFYGFLPRKAGELKQALIAILTSPYTAICYESPHRIMDVLKLLSTLDPGRKLVIARELTKIYEEIVRGTPLQLIKQWEEKTVKGEIVLLIEGQPPKQEEDWLTISIEEHVGHLQNTYSLSRMEAIKLAAQQRGMSKREIYRSLHKSVS